MTIQQYPFPGIVYVMPALMNFCSMTLWEETCQMDLEFLKVPKAVETNLQFSSISLQQQIEDKFHKRVGQR